MNRDHELQQRLAPDTAKLLAVIARIAPRARLAPHEIAIIDQLAAHAASPREH